MRSSRFMLPFSLGAVSVLMVVAATEWATPGVLGRAHNALRPGISIPAAGAPEGSGPAAPVVVRPADSAPEAPPAGTLPIDPATAIPPPAIPAARAEGLRLLIPVQVCGR